MSIATWKFVSFDVQGAQLRLSGLRLWGGSTAVDAGAVVTASHLPVEGELSTLLDGDFGTFCAWPAEVVQLPGFWIQLELPEAQEVLKVQASGPDADSFPLRFVIVAPSGDGLDLVAVFAGPSSPCVMNLDDYRVMNTDTVLYLHGPTGWLDHSQKQTPVTRSGASIFVDQAQLFNGQPTLRFNGSDYLVAPPSVNFAFGTRDFTIAAWVKDPSGGRLLTNRLNGGYSGTWSMMVSQTSVGFTEVIVGEPGISASFPSSEGEFFHVAITRSGGVLRAFHNGHLVAAQANSTNFHSTSGQLAIGRAAPSESGRWLGWLAGLVVCNGRALWTDDFIPQPFNPISPHYLDKATLKKTLLTFKEGELLPQGDAVGLSLAAPISLDIESGGHGRIYGTVGLHSHSGSIPLARRIRLHRSRDGLLVRETWSDAQGNYCFEGLSTRYTYDVIAHDHEGLLQSVIANDLTPEVSA